MAAPTLICDLCGKLFNDEKKLVAHCKRHSDDHDNVCGHCGKVFDSRVKLRNHVRKVHKDFDECKFCPYVGEPSNVLRHEKEKHKDSDLKCSKCCKTFTRMTTLKSHEGKCGPKVKKLHECAHCGKKFNRKDVLDKHMKTHSKTKKKPSNSDEEEFHCDKCHKKYKHQTNLIRHQKKDHSENQDVVSFNGVGFGMFEESGNIVKEKGKEYKCQHCNFEATNNWKLKRHIESKHGSDCGLKKLSCDQCGKMFKDSWKLDRHVASVHTHSSNVECDICKKSFQDEYHCKRHQERGKCSSNSLKTGRPKKIDNKSPRLIRKETKEKLDAITSDEKMKENIISKLQKQESVGVNALSEEDAINLITDISISDKKAIKLIKFLKDKVNKGIFTSNLKKALVSRKKIFTELISREELVFHDSKGSEIKQTLVYVNDIDAMTDIVAVARGVDLETSEVVLAVDGGKGKVETKFDNNKLHPFILRQSFVDNESA